MTEFTSSRAHRSGRVLLAFARTRPGGLIAGLACTYAAGLLPVARLANLPRAVAFRHPKPEVADHVAIVPKAVVPTLCAAVERVRPEVLLDILAAAREASRYLPPGERVVTVNVGVRQDVRQLHAHLLPVEGAVSLLEGARTVGHLDGTRATLSRILSDAVRALGGCASDMDGSLLVRGFETDAEAEVLVSIASRGRNG